MNKLPKAPTKMLNHLVFCTSILLLYISALFLPVEGQRSCTDINKIQNKSIDKLLGEWFILYQPQKPEYCHYIDVKPEESNNGFRVTQNTILHLPNANERERLIVQHYPLLVNTTNRDTTSILSITGSEPYERESFDFVVFNTNYKEYSIVMTCPGGIRPNWISIYTTHPTKYEHFTVLDWAMRFIESAGIDPSPYQFYHNNFCDPYSRPYKKSPSDTLAVIRDVSMSEEMQLDVVQIAKEAIEKFDDEWGIATHIREEMERKYDPFWHCIVGKNYFGSSVRFKRNYFLSFKIQGYYITVFKSREEALKN